MQTHDLKILPIYFDAVANGSKTFEVRKNDRNFKAGDRLILNECYFESGAPNFTGRRIERDVTYVLHGPAFGVESGYCVMSLQSTLSAQEPTDVD